MQVACWEKVWGKARRRGSRRIVSALVLWGFGLLAGKMLPEEVCKVQKYQQLRIWKKPYKLEVLEVCNYLQVMRFMSSINK